MEQNEPIPSALPKTLLKTIDNSYIKHVSNYIGYFGVKKGSGMHKKYQEGFKAYAKEVEEALEEKAASVETESESIKQINKYLVTKWHWIIHGLFDGMMWTTDTRVPLCTQTVIKHLDALVDPIANAFGEVR
jgi:hypothetical protein